MTHHSEALTIAESHLLTPTGLDLSVLERVFGQMHAHQLDYSDLYFQYHRTEAWSLEEGIVKSGSFNIDQGVGVRAISGEKTAFAYSDDISLTALLAAADATRAIGEAGGSGSTRIGKPIAVPSRYHNVDPFLSLADTDKVRLLERLEQFARAEDSRVKEVMAHLVGSWETILVARNDGHLAADVRPLVRVSISVIMEEGGKREQGSGGGGGRFDYA
nr:DNA gyrase modulator [Denitromonas sp.]